MNTETVTDMHVGRKISRIRELRGMKQETLAAALGVTQQTISKLEQSEHVDDERLAVVAEKLGVSVEAIKSFDEEKAINFISSTFNQSGLFNTSCTFNFNPVEKIVELYDALLKSEREKIALLERLLEQK